MRHHLLPVLAAAACWLLPALLLPAAAPAAPTSVAGHLRYAIDRDACCSDFSSTAARQDIVILQPYQTDRMRSLKAQNPGLKVLVYQDVAGMTYRDEWGNSTTAVSTQEADAHPEWYLLNKSGQRFNFGPYPWVWAADIGQQSYQQRWVDNVSRILQQGWDGVFMDDLNPSIRAYYDPAQVQKYDTDAEYGEAMRQAVAYIGPRIRGAGKLLIANIGFWRDYSPAVTAWLQYLDGGMEEYFTKFWGPPGDGYIWDWGAHGWQTLVDNVKAAESDGKYFLGVSHSDNDDVQAARYGWATLLLAAGGHALFALHGDYTNETWFPEYDYPIGEPTGPEQRDPSGIHRRTFTGGLVLVNPTDAFQSVSFGGTYSGSGVQSATGAGMAPHTGLVLVRDGVEPPGGEPAGDVTAPATPTGLTATPGIGSVTLNWNDSAEPDLSHYRVYRRISGGDYAPPVRSDSSAYRDTGLTAGVTYIYSVSAVDAAGNESAKTAEVRVVPKAHGPKKRRTPQESAPVTGGDVLVTGERTTGGGIRATATRVRVECPRRARGGCVRAVLTRRSCRRVRGRRRACRNHVLARRALRLEAGERTTLNLRLNARGRRLLARRGRLAVRLRILGAGGRTRASRKVVLRA